MDGFTAWLAANAQARTSVGDLARDAAADPDWPQGPDELETWFDYLTQERAWTTRPRPSSRCAGPGRRTAAEAGHAEGPPVPDARAGRTARRPAAYSSSCCCCGIGGGTWSAGTGRGV